MKNPVDLKEGEEVWVSDVEDRTRRHGHVERVLKRRRGPEGDAVIGYRVRWSLKFGLHRILVVWVDADRYRISALSAVERLGGLAHGV